jgi:hypothetical protein
VEGGRREDGGGRGGRSRSGGVSASDELALTWLCALSCTATNTMFSTSVHMLTKPLWLNGCMCLFVMQ